jgi:hypothetical protein
MTVLAVISYYNITARVKAYKLTTQKSMNKTPLHHVELCAPSLYNHTILTYYYNYNYDHNITARKSYRERRERHTHTFNNILIDNSGERN